MLVSSSWLKQFHSLSVPLYVISINLSVILFVQYFYVLSLSRTVAMHCYPLGFGSIAYTVQNMSSAQENMHYRDI